MKTIWVVCGLLTLFVSIFAKQNPDRPYDIIVRDDKEPFMASFQSRTGAYGVQSCSEYGFGSGANARIETLGCITQITFDFKWRGDHDFNFHPRKECDATLTIKVGDNLHGTFTVDTCAKTATGAIRNETQNIDLMNLADTDITDSKDYCGGPPACK
jgi:hypothetical protein